MIFGVLTSVFSNRLTSSDSLDFKAQRKDGPSSTPSTLEIDTERRDDHFSIHSRLDLNTRSRDNPSQVLYAMTEWGRTPPL